MFHTNRLFSVYYQIIKGICRAQDLKEIKIKWIVVKTGDLNRFGGGGESYESLEMVKLIIQEEDFLVFKREFSLPLSFKIYYIKNFFFFRHLILLKLIFF